MPSNEEIILAVNLYVLADEHIYKDKNGNTMIAPIFVTEAIKIIETDRLNRTAGDLVAFNRQKI